MKRQQKNKQKIDVKILYGSSHPSETTITGGALWKKAVLEISQNSQENTCARVCFLVKLFFCEFSEISKNTFFTEHLRMTASR